MAHLLKIIMRGQMVLGVVGLKIMGFSPLQDMIVCYNTSMLVVKIYKYSLSRLRQLTASTFTRLTLAGFFIRRTV